MQNIYLDLIMKRLSGNKKNLYVFSRFRLYAWVYTHVYVHTTFLVGEIVDRFLARALYG